MTVNVGRIYAAGAISNGYMEKGSKKDGGWYQLDMNVIVGEGQVNVDRIILKIDSPYIGMSGSKKPIATDDIDNVKVELIKYIK
ncbi:hypothetical protein IIE26_27350 (plasmid) [Cytobacillus oceanisediminis]|uniref:hypothetical protein n=1 Tax=Cytobacillus oceanisediminis TaxID=665099 RepID=UPI001864125F|nr:hypothetical protein [Cytobacillus oceanisediminis]QOK30086.1 hypothetical protein IIE26_27350 [Cytobacillus oceanisediminis]